jgi:hypothetical protein
MTKRIKGKLLKSFRLTHLMSYEPTEVSLGFQAIFKRFPASATPPSRFGTLKLSQSLKDYKITRNNYDTKFNNREF